MPSRVCSECPNLLAGKGPQAITCSEKCRSARSRRLARERRERGEAVDPAVAERQALTQRMADVVRDHATDEAKKQLAAEVGPVVRAAITDDTLRALRDLVAITPQAVEALKADLESDDPGLRHRAAALVVKYTMGHPAIVQPEAPDTGRPLVVEINAPRPEPAAPAEDPAIDSTATDEEGTCDMCGTPLPDGGVDGSDRCPACWERQQREVRERFGQRE